MTLILPASLIITAPALILIILAGSYLFYDLIGYHRFVTDDLGKYAWHAMCQDQGKTVPCICDPMLCRPITTIKEWWVSKFTIDAMLGIIPSIFFVALFVSQRKYHKIQGIQLLTNWRPKIILITSTIIVCLAAYSVVTNLFGPVANIMMWLTRLNELAILSPALGDRLYSYSPSFIAMIQISWLAIAAGLLLLGKERLWVWKTSVGILAVSVTIMLLGANNGWLADPYRNHPIFIMLIMSCTALYLLLRRDTREYFHV